jgi:hypothetical protein
LEDPSNALQERSSVSGWWLAGFLSVLIEGWGIVRLALDGDIGEYRERAKRWRSRHAQQRHQQRRASANGRFCTTRQRFCGGGIGDSLTHRMACREMAMTELKQQTIALWIVLMLLLMIPWVLE